MLLGVNSLFVNSPEPHVDIARGLSESTDVLLFVLTAEAKALTALVVELVFFHFPAENGFGALARTLMCTSLGN